MILFDSGVVSISGSSPITVATKDLDGVQPVTLYLENHGDADVGAVTVEHSPIGYPDYPGPWLPSTAASAALSGLAAGETAAFVLDAPVEGFRVTVVPGPYATSVVMRAVGAGSGENGPFETFTVAPSRALDTRYASPAGPIAAQGTLSVRLTGALTNQGGVADCGIPDEATAVFVNAVVVNPASAGHLTVYPYGTTQPVVSTLNYVAGQVVANNALVKIAAPRSPRPTFDLNVFTYAAADVVVDVTGYLAPRRR